MCGEDGTLRARDLPEVLSNELLQRIAGRLFVMVQAAETGFGATEALHLTFRDHALVVFSGRGGSLAVLANPATNPDTLQFGARLALRKLAAGAAPSTGAPGRLPRPPGVPRSYSSRSPGGPPSDPNVRPRKRKNKGGIWE